MWCSITIEIRTTILSYFNGAADLEIEKNTMLIESEARFMSLVIYHAVTCHFFQYYVIGMLKNFVIIKREQNSG